MYGELVVSLLAFEVNDAPLVATSLLLTFYHCPLLFTSWDIPSCMVSRRCFICDICYISL